MKEVFKVNEHISTMAYAKYTLKLKTISACARFERGR